MNQIAPPRLRRYTNDINHEVLNEVRRNLLNEFDLVENIEELNLEWEDMITEEIESDVEDCPSDIDEEMEIEYDNEFEESITEIRPWDIEEDE